MRLPLVLTLCVALGACANAQERQERAMNEAKWACADMGNQPETPAHAACVERLYGQVRADQEAARRASAAALMGAGAAILTAPPVHPTQTSCRWFAGYWVCN